MEFWKPENVTKKEHSTALRTLIRTLEIVSALILIFWSITRLPLALKLLTDFAKQTFALLLTTPSVFLIGNAIVVTLVAQFQSLTNSTSDLYDEFITESRNRIPIPTHAIQKVEKIKSLQDSSSSTEPATESEVIRYCRRTQSERLMSANCGKGMKKELRRTKTENHKMKVKTAAFEVVDELNGDEFRRRVEAFIAKHQRLIRDDNIALVVSN